MEGNTMKSSVLFLKEEIQNALVNSYSVIINKSILTEYSIYFWNNLTAIEMLKPDLIILSFFWNIVLESYDKKKSTEEDGLLYIACITQSHLHNFHFPFLQVQTSRVSLHFSFIL
jgi:hypothetical protein